MYNSGLQHIKVAGNEERFGLESFLNTRPNISDYEQLHLYETMNYDDAGTYPRNVDHFVKWLRLSKKSGSDL